MNIEIILSELAILLRDWGGNITDDEAEFIQRVIDISTKLGYQHLSKEQVDQAVRIYNRYCDKKFGGDGEFDSGSLG